MTNIRRTNLKKEYLVPTDESFHVLVIGKIGSRYYVGLVPDCDRDQDEIMRFLGTYGFRFVTVSNMEYTMASKSLVQNGKAVNPGPGFTCVDIDVICSDSKNVMMQEISELGHNYLQGVLEQNRRQVAIHNYPGSQNYPGSNL